MRSARSTGASSCRERYHRGSDRTCTFRGLRARMFMMFCPSRSRMFIFVFCSSGICRRSVLKPAVHLYLAIYRTKAGKPRTETFLLDQPMSRCLPHRIRGKTNFQDLQSAFRQTLVTHHVTNLRQSDQHSCTAIWCEAPLHYTLGTVRCRSR